MKAPFRILQTAQDIVGFNGVLRPHAPALVAREIDLENPFGVEVEENLSN